MLSVGFRARLSRLVVVFFVSVEKDIAINFGLMLSIGLRELKRLFFTTWNTLVKNPVNLLKKITRIEFQSLCDES